MLADAQTHTFPADALTRERIALAMGSRDGTCAAELDLHRARVTRAFQEVMFARTKRQRRSAGREWHRRGLGSRRAAAQFAARLTARGFARRRPRAASCSWNSAASSAVRRLDAPGRARLDTLLPRLLAAIADLRATGPQADVLRRVLKVLEAIGSRSAYFALLNENARCAAR